MNAADIASDCMKLRTYSIWDQLLVLDRRVQILHTRTLCQQVPFRNQDVTN